MSLEEPSDAVALVARNRRQELVRSFHVTSQDRSLIFDNVHTESIARDIEVLVSDIDPVVGR